MYRCESCDIWFCEKHLQPRLIFVRGLDGIPPEYKLEFQKEWNREKSHPDFQYSKKILERLKIGEQERRELMTEALDRMNAHWNKGKYIRTKPTERHYVCPNCGNLYDVYDPIEYCKKCGSKLVEQPRRLSRGEVKEFLKTDLPQEPSVLAENTTNKKEVVTSEGYFHFEKRAEEDTEKPKRRRHFPIGKVIGAILVVVIIGALLWYAPTIISFVQNYSSQSSYTKLTLMEGYPPNYTYVQFGDLNYSFGYTFQNNYYLSVGNSLLEGKNYPDPTNGSTYNDIGLEIQVSEAYSDYIVLLVKPVQNYLAQSGYTKLIIANGQYQTVNFSENEYIFSYAYTFMNSYNQGTVGVPVLTISTPLLQTEQTYLSTPSDQFTSKFGLNIIAWALPDYVTIFVKPSY